MFADLRAVQGHGRRVPLRRRRSPSAPPCRPAATRSTSSRSTPCRTSSRSLVLVLLGKTTVADVTRRACKGLRERADQAASDPERRNPPTPTHPQRSTAPATESDLNHTARLPPHARTSHRPASDLPSAALGGIRCRGADGARLGDRHRGRRSDGGARRGRRRRSASSSSARRTTSATTRRPTTAARPSTRQHPDLEVLTAENVPEDDNAATHDGADDRQGRQDHLRHVATATSTRRSRSPRSIPTSSSSSRAT